MYNSNKKNIGDYIISVMIVIQYFLIILQQCMIDILHMPAESTTIYRVIFSAIPVLISFPFIIKRELILTIIIYGVTMFVMLLHSVIFPENTFYIKTEGFRFLLPVCIPCLLGVCAIRNFDIFMRSVVVMSWFVMLLLAWYIYCYFVGVFVIDSYNMGFGYALLLPTLILYNERRIIPVIVSVLSFITIVALGSRGPILVILLFLGYDIFINYRKYLLPFIIMIVVVSNSIPLLIDLLESIGIDSRTLTLLVSGDIEQDSGRSSLYAMTIDAIINNPIFGCGIYSDRVLLGIYCHNIILELLINWGIPLTIFFIVLFIYKFIYIYTNIDKYKRRIFILFVLAGIFPLFLSSSYINCSPFYTTLGIMVLFSRQVKVKRLNSIK